MTTRFASAESIIVSEEDPSYAGLRKLSNKHETVNHSKEFSRDGIGNNQGEIFNWRLKRGLRWIYLNVSNKYLLDYGE